MRLLKEESSQSQSGKGGKTILFQTVTEENFSGYLA